MPTATMIVFPTHVAQLSGCGAVQVGARHCWIHDASGTGTPVKVNRSAFAEPVLSEQGNALAFEGGRVLASLREHVIAWAYPSSQDAEKHGYSHTSCYTYTARNIAVARPTLAEARPRMRLSASFAA